MYPLAGYCVEQMFRAAGAGPEVEGASEQGRQVWYSV